jgi:hypothetical protein
MSLDVTYMEENQRGFIKGRNMLLNLHFKKVHTIFLYTGLQKVNEVIYRP